MAEIEQVLAKLKNLTKKELINIFEELLTQGTLSLDGLNSYFSNESKMTQEEEIIYEKLLAQDSLTDEDRIFVKNALAKVENRKVGNLIKAKSSFVGFLINRNLQYVFEKCWKIYPRKVGKQQGAKAFVKLFSDIKYKDLTATAQYILTKITEYRNDCEKDNREEQYIMHFGTFCNSKKYL